MNNHFLSEVINFMVFRQENANLEADVGSACQLKELALTRWRKRGLKADNVSVIVCEFEESEHDDVEMEESCGSMYKCLMIDHERPCKRKLQANQSLAIPGEAEEKRSREESSGCFMEGVCDDCLTGKGDASDTE